MRSKSIKEIVSYILNSHYLRDSVKLSKLLSDLCENKPRELVLKQDDWDDLDDVNSDAVFKIDGLLIDRGVGKLNSAEKRPGYIVVIPSNLSKSLYNNQLESFLIEVETKLSLMDDTRKGYVFERLCSDVLKYVWPDNIHHGRSGDQGIDIICSEELTFPVGSKLQVAIQCKYYNTKIDTPVVRKLLGDLLVQTFEDSGVMWPIMPMLLTNRGFTAEAQKLASKYGIELMTFKRLLEKILRVGEIDLESVLKSNFGSSSKY